MERSAPLLEQEERPATDPTPEPLVPLERVIEHLGLSASAFYSLRYRDEGPPAYRLGRRLMYRWSDVERWVESRRDPRPVA